MIGCTFLSDMSVMDNRKYTQVVRDDSNVSRTQLVKYKEFARTKSDSGIYSLRLYTLECSSLHLYIP